MGSCFYNLTLWLSIDNCFPGNSILSKETKNRLVVLTPPNEGRPYIRNQPLWFKRSQKKWKPFSRRFQHPNVVCKATSGSAFHPYSSCGHATISIPNNLLFALFHFRNSIFLKWQGIIFQLISKKRHQASFWHDTFVKSILWVDANLDKLEDFFNDIRIVSGESCEVSHYVNAEALSSGGVVMRNYAACKVRRLFVLP